MRTLVVEDELTSRLMLQSVLSGYGECHSAVNGEEALEAFRMAVKTPQGVVQAFNALCDEYVAKPIDSGKLVRKLGQMGMID